MGRTKHVSHPCPPVQSNLLQALFDALQDYLFIMDVDGRILRANPAAQQRLGYTPDELSAMHLLDLHPPERRQEAAAALSGQVDHSSVPLRARDGCLIPVETRLARCLWAGRPAIVGLSHDMTLALESAHLHEQANHYARQMASLHEIGLSITAQLDRTQLMHDLVEHMRKLLDPDVFYLGTYDPHTHLLEHPFFYYFGSRLDVQPRDLYQAPGLSGEVIFTRQTLHIRDMDDPHEMSRHNHIVLAARMVGTRTYVGAPMLFRDQVVGVLSIQHTNPDAFTPEQVRLLETIAAQAAVALENSRLYEQAQQEIAQRRLAEESLQEANRQLRAQVARIEVLQAELKEQAIRDALTGVYNRRYLDETLNREIAQAGRQDQSVAILMLDIDHFKDVNDRFSHKTGDLMLQALGQVLSEHTRLGDIACRYGGEEFVVVMPGATLQVAIQRAEHIRQQFAALRVPYEDRQAQATLSVGVAMYPQHAATGEQVLVCADRALYQQAKQAGRNRVGVYQQEA